MQLNITDFTYKKGRSIQLNREGLLYRIMLILSRLCGGIISRKYNDGEYFFTNVKHAEIYGCKSSEEIVGRADKVLLVKHPTLLRLILQNDKKARQGGILAIEKAPNVQLFLCLKAPYYEFNRQIGVEVIGVPLYFDQIKLVFIEKIMPVLRNMFMFKKRIVGTKCYLV